MLEATIHGSRSGREAVLPPPPRCQTSSQHHKYIGVDRDMHSYILLSQHRWDETSAQDFSHHGGQRSRPGPLSRCREVLVMRR